jgi:hypothetical protein
VLAQLRFELDSLDQAIASLERLSAQKHPNQEDAPEEPRRRGRRPKNPAPLSDPRVSVEKVPVEKRSRGK